MLLGFDTLTSDGVDFSDVNFGAELGAKVGAEATDAVSSKPIEFSKLLGFQTVRVNNRVDLQDDTIAAKLGAKVGDGVEPEAAPSRD